MTNNSGRMADATGLSSASPIEPVPVSPVPASIPCAEEAVARAIVVAEGFTSADATVIHGMKSLKAWESRLPIARAAIAAFNSIGKEK